MTQTVDADLWMCALDLALAGGWTPRGAQLVDGRPDAAAPWSYATPRRQRVGDEDARGMALGLGATLTSVSDRTVPLRGLPFGHDHTAALIQRASAGSAVAPSEVAAAYDLLSGSPKKDALGLISFLQLGGFTVLPAGISPTGQGESHG